MATKKKLLQAAAGSAGGEALNVEDVFSTYLYDGTGTTLEINNGIDLDGEGGLVWAKRRDGTGDHWLVDTERGLDKSLKTNTTDANNTGSQQILSFDSDGFTLGNRNEGQNYNGLPFASWTFRKAPKFFTCLTYTGTGTAQNISHDLGTTVGTLIVKRTDSSDNWTVWHRGVNSGSGSSFLNLNLTSGYSNSATRWNSTAPTSTQFSVGTHASVNASGGTYVAYLFAHNDGDGDFGPTGDQDIIKCGSFTEINGSDVTVDLGFEPQWIMIKTSSTTGGWGMYDVMRGWNSGGTDYALTANTSDAEASVGDRWLINPNGFTWKDTTNARDIIYIAIRRGPMAVPESATEVFDVTTWTSSGEPKFQTSFASDMAMNRNVDSSYDMRIAARLTQGRFLKTSTTDAEASNANFNFDYMDGFLASGGSSSFYSWQWKRAPSFCDVVAYTGNGTAGRTVSHNLGVAPEMMWVKKRNATGAWPVYHVGAHATSPENYFLQLNSTITATLNSARWNNTAPTATEFTVGNGGTVNDPNDTYIAYLFASLDGVSKVGSYTATGSDQNIDCGFSSGARFVLIKGTSLASAWVVIDTERGLVAGNDPWLRLDSNVAQNSGYDMIDPYSSGFTVTGSNANVNSSGNTYIFYAIA